LEEALDLPFDRLLMMMMIKYEKIFVFFSFKPNSKMVPKFQVASESISCSPLSLKFVEPF